jgi:hypothetical protein
MLRVKFTLEIPLTDLNGVLRWFRDWSKARRSHMMAAAMVYVSSDENLEAVNETIQAFMRENGREPSFSAEVRPDERIH